VTYYGLIISLFLHALAGAAIVRALPKSPANPTLIEVSVVPNELGVVSKTTPKQKKKRVVTAVEPSPTVSAPAPSVPAPMQPAPGDGMPSAAAQTAASAKGDGDGPVALDFKSRLRIAIESLKEYPARARARGQSGIVKVGFTLKKDGMIVGIHLSERSEYDILNHAAVDTLVRLGHYKAIPDDVAMGDLSFVVPLNFKLND
jgi:protein TonB